MNKNYVVKTIILLNESNSSLPLQLIFCLLALGKSQFFFTHVVCRPLEWALVHQASENKVTCQARKLTGPGKHFFKVLKLPQQYIGIPG